MFPLSYTRRLWSPAETNRVWSKTQPSSISSPVQQVCECHDQGPPLLLGGGHLCRPGDERRLAKHLLLGVELFGVALPYEQGRDVSKALPVHVRSMPCLHSKILINEVYF